MNTATPRRGFAPKGSRYVSPLSAPQTDQPRHVFVARSLDPVSCFWCNLPRENGRHS